MKASFAGIVACTSLVVATGLIVAGIYTLAGAGWAMLAGAAPLFVFGLVILRGLSE